MIHGQPALKGLRVGLFVGGDGQGTRSMSADQVITDKDTLRKNPPDVLLTNYKMLDYLLMRPTDQKLWHITGRTHCAIWWWMSCTPLMALRHGSFAADPPPAGAV